ncbi:uncharacterized protein [Clytia hemisphaerica]|uniref:Uncharacterized protein n=1 Tax=Clytia hemisphaerica TaxID=252671 RepID=A0A7M5VFN4_9CNID
MSYYNNQGRIQEREWKPSRRKHYGAEKSHFVDVYKYSRPVEVSNLNESTTHALQHWSIVLDFFDEDYENGFPAKICYEASKKSGHLYAESRRFQDGEIRKSRGTYQKISQQPIEVSVEESDDFLCSWNQRRLRYSEISNNCQMFCKSFTEWLGISDDSWTFEDVYRVGLAIGGAVLGYLFRR